MSNLLRSLLFSLILCFSIPCMIVVFLWVILSSLTYVPFISYLGEGGMDALQLFLRILGSGHPLQGITIIGLTCSTVGGLFDLYNFSVYQWVKS